MLLPPCYRIPLAGAPTKRLSRSGIFVAAESRFPTEQVFSSLKENESMAPESAFHYDIEKSEDGHGNKITTINCHGRLVAANSNEITNLVRPLIPLGGRIVIDLGDTNYLDSSGLGALVGLKVSALKQGFCILELANLTPRVLELVRISNLRQLFSS
jgi:anti-anti-sigma factor